MRHRAHTEIENFGQNQPSAFHMRDQIIWFDALHIITLKTCAPDTRHNNILIYQYMICKIGDGRNRYHIYYTNEILLAVCCGFTYHNFTLIYCSFFMQKILTVLAVVS